MSKEDVINYVMTTPSNPNKAVLSGMLDGIASTSGGGTPLLVNAVYDGEGKYDLDKTFGEIRNAFNSGRIVVITKDLSNKTSSHINVSLVQEVYFMVDFESPYANGSVSTYGGSYSVSVIEAPYTLEALDVQYPYITD